MNLKFISSDMNKIIPHLFFKYIISTCKSFENITNKRMELIVFLTCNLILPIYKLR